MDSHTKQVWMASLRTGTQQRIQYGNYTQQIMSNGWCTAHKKQRPQRNSH